tara:strand:- start:5518 stop:8037 length:2520 start_codon:yes stop_codon:yes gene_type:complete
MARRTIQSPGVEIRESDLSLRTVSQGTTTYITGFSNQGPTDEVVGVTGITDFEQIYGMPRTPAERYFYHTVKAALNSTGRVLVNRLPYGEEEGQGFGSKVGVLAYPAAIGKRDTAEITVFGPIDGDAETNGLSSADVLYTDLTDDFDQWIDNGVGQNPRYESTTAYLSDFDATQETVNDFSRNEAFYIGKPKQFEITQEQYLRLSSGDLFTGGWSNIAGSSEDFTSLQTLSSAAVIVINKGQTIVDGQFNGYYIGLADNTNINPASNFDAINSIQTTTRSAGEAGSTNFTTIPETRFEFSLTATPEFGDNPATNSISQVMEDRIASYDVSTREFDDTLNVGVFKIRQSVFSKDAYGLDYLLEEGYNGSIGQYRQRNAENGGAPVNFFLETEENSSRNIDILVNPFLSDKIAGIQLNDDGTPKKKIRVLTQTLVDAVSSGDVPLDIAGVGTTDDLAYLTSTLGLADSLFPIGVYGETNLADKKIGKVPAKLDRALERVKNDEKFNIDIIAEGGLGTINTYSETAEAGLKELGFDDTRTTPAIEALRTSRDLEALGRDARDNYMAIFNRFNTFCGPTKDGGRGDVLYIADPIRQVIVSGKDSKILDDKSKNFYTDIYWALRHQFELANTSYATVFANFMKVYDSYSGLFIYVPSSGFASAKMASVDAQIGPWGAPAGFNRGIINDAVDIAVTPNQRQRDDLYSVNLNPIATFQDRGNVFFGQKTLLKKPSAFDRINVRRTFLYLEKITKSTMKFFLFENNTLFTRSRVVNTLTPTFERIKVDDGLYDYLIVCDERNNTPEVIDQNEMVVDIYLKPVKTAEFILVNFYATRTDANFQELAGG